MGSRKVKKKKDQNKEWVRKLLLESGFVLIFHFPVLRSLFLVLRSSNFSQIILDCWVSNRPYYLKKSVFTCLKCTVGNCNSNIRYCPRIATNLTN